MIRPGSALALLALLGGPVAAQQKIARRIAIDPEASIRIYSLYANARLIGWDRDSIVVTGTAPAGTMFYFGGSGRLAKMGLERDEKSAAVPSGLGELEIRIPERARVWIKANEGWIEATGLAGEADLSTVGGSIKAAVSVRLLTAETLEGSIQVSGSSQLVRVKTGNGKVLLHRPVGDLTVSTVAGPVSLFEAAPATVRIETVSGPVIYDGRLDRRSTLDIQTHSGDVELQLPRDTGAEFDLHSIDGTMQIALSPKGPQAKPVRGKPLFFGNGGGGAHVVVRSFKGNIRLVGKE